MADFKALWLRLGAAHRHSDMLTDHYSRRVH